MRQSGFTLIEVMIVTVILAILFSIALPLYQDYTARAQVAATITSFSGVKVGVVSYKYDHDNCEGSDNYYQQDIDNIVNGNESHVGSATVTDHVTYCLIQITMSDKAVPNLRGKNLQFRVNFDSSGSSAWTCSSSYIDNKYLPPNCRS
ncbi:MAG TPA: pilin [Terriglobales bacterium]|nr:pilin [Terriglobales bacterium]